MQRNRIKRPLPIRLAPWAKQFRCTTCSHEFPAVLTSSTSSMGRRENEMAEVKCPICGNRKLWEAIILWLFRKTKGVEYGGFGVEIR